MSWSPEHEAPRVLVETAGPGESIAGTSSGGHSLHIYRLAPGDWLVSEVGRRNEGRAATLESAISALPAGGSLPTWWSLVPAALDDEKAPSS